MSAKLGHQPAAGNRLKLPGVRERFMEASMMVDIRGLMDMMGDGGLETGITVMVGEGRGS